MPGIYGKKVSAEKVTPPGNSSSLPSQALDLRSAVLQSTMKNLVLFQVLIVLRNTRYCLKARCYFYVMAVTELSMIYNFDHCDPTFRGVHVRDRQSVCTCV